MVLLLDLVPIIICIIDDTCTSMIESGLLICIYQVDVNGDGTISLKEFIELNERF